MTYNDATSSPTPASIATVLDDAALASAARMLPYGTGGELLGGVSFGLATETDEKPEIIVLHACVEHHVVYHVGHQDPATGMSVYDGSVTTTIPC